MEYLKIHDWGKWQSYRKDRDLPPWIKVHRCLLRNSKWAKLTDAEKGQLISLWIVAADRDGEIDADQQSLKKTCQLDRGPNLSKFIDLGFIDDNVASKGRQPGVNPTPEIDIEEKRREENIKKRKTLLPKNYSLTEDHKMYALEKGIAENQIQDTFEAFCIHHQKLGSEFLDWYAAWQTWVRNKIKWDKEKAAGSQLQDPRTVCRDCGATEVLLISGVCNKCRGEE